MKNVMKIIFTLCLVVIASVAVVAQDDQEITDEQLRKYAIQQEVVYLMKKDISAEINAMIKAQEGMTGKRYTELSSTKGDADALAAIEAKEWEVKFFEQTDKLKKDRTESLIMINSELATKMVGERGKTYKAIKELLKTDESVKSRYDAIYAQLKLEGA